MKRTRVALVAMAAALCVRAEADASFDANATVSTNLTLVGEYVINVASGITVEYSGAISGSGPLHLTGGGTLVLSGANNTFTEGVQVSQGFIRVDAAGALGPGRIYLDGTLKSSSNTNYGVDRQVDFNVAGASFANTILIEGVEPFSHAAYIKASKSVTLSGAVALNANYYSNCYNVFQSGSSSDKTPVLTFTGGLTCGATKKYLRLFTYGNITFNCQFSLGSTLNLGGGSTFTGTATFGSSGSTATTIQLDGNVLAFSDEDVFHGGVLIVSKNGNYTDTAKTRVDLCGYDQTFSALDYNTTQTYSPASGADGSWIYSASPATMTLIGASTSYTGWQRFCGAVSLVLDAAGYPSFVQTLSYRAHTMTGSLRVTNGTLVLTNSTTFKNVPEVHVSTNGTLTVAGSTSCFFGATNLVVDGTLTFAADAVTPLPTDYSTVIRLGCDATLTVPTDTTLRVKDLYVDGVRHDSDTYPADGTIAQLVGGGTVIVDNGEVSVVDATWTGLGGVDLSAKTAANWSIAPVVPDFTKGKFRATFASGGSRAEVDGALKFLKLGFSASNDFELAAANGSSSAELLAEGLVASAPGAEARKYVISAPLSLSVDQTWSIATNATVELAGDMNIASGMRLTSEGDGALGISGESTIAAGATISNRLFCVTGTLATPGHVDQGPIGYWGSSYMIYDQYVMRVFRDVPGSLLSFSNAVVEKAVWTRGRGANTSAETDRWLEFAPNSTNVFKGAFYIASAGGHIVQGANSLVAFERGAILGASTYGENINFEVRGGIFDCGTGSGFYLLNSTLKLMSSGSSGKLRLVGGSFLDCCAHAAITNNTALYLLGNTSTIDMHGYTQFVKHLESEANAVITGECPAKMCVGDMNSDTAYTYYGRFSNGAGLLKTGTSGTLVLAGYTSVREHPTCGDLGVEGGTLRMTNATWMNGTNVCVSGSGTLELKNRRHFNKQFSVLSISGNGVVDIEEGLCEKVYAMYVDGNPVPTGTYGGANAPEGTDKTYAAHFSGSGTVRVGDVGFMMTVK